jgi:hypothetical protein
MSREIIVGGLRGRAGAWGRAAVLLGLALAWPGSARGEDTGGASASQAAEKASARAETPEKAPAEAPEKARAKTPEKARAKAPEKPRAEPEGRASASASASKAADEPLQRVAGNMYMEVKARDLRLSPSNTQRLKRIAARYFKATRKRLVVTGGTRSPLRQAQLVYDKLKHGDDIVALYEHRAAAIELRAAYRDALARGLKRKATIRAIREAIDAQIARGIYISRHLRSGAVDVRSWNMEGALEKALREAVKQEPGASLMDERDGAEPHFHLNLN